MNAPKHTPGPWRAGIAPEVDCRRDEYGDELCCVGHCTYDAIDIFVSRTGEHRPCDVPLDEHEANARLIAAAPELLQSLKEALGFLQDMNVTGDLPDTMRAAIEKAEPSHD